MDPVHEEKAEAQESTRSGAWQVGRSQGRSGQKQQEEPRNTARWPATPARSSQEVVNAVIALIRTRFEDVAIGLGELGIRYRAAANR